MMISPSPQPLPDDVALVRHRDDVELMPRVALLRFLHAPPPALALPARFRLRRDARL